MTANNIFPDNRLPMNRVSEERYRVLKFGKPGYELHLDGPIRTGYLADGGKAFVPRYGDFVQSMHTGSFHSGERLKAHMGSYDLRLQADREPDERSVMQAFFRKFTGSPTFCRIYRGTGGFRTAS